MTYLISCSLDMSSVPGDPIGTMFGEIDPIHESRESALAAIAELDASGDWPDGRPQYHLGAMDIPARAARALYRQAEYDIEAVLDGWERGEYGDLCDSETRAVIRKATKSEAAESLESSPEGHIEVDGHSCFVAF